MSLMTRYTRKEAAAELNMGESTFRRNVEPHLGEPQRKNPRGKVYWTERQLQSYLVSLERHVDPVRAIMELKERRSPSRALPCAIPGASGSPLAASTTLNNRVKRKG